MCRRCGKEKLNTWPPKRTPQDSKRGKALRLPRRRLPEEGCPEEGCPEKLPRRRPPRRGRPEESRPEEGGPEEGRPEEAAPKKAAPKKAAPKKVARKGCSEEGCPEEATGAGRHQARPVVKSQKPVFKVEVKAPAQELAEKHPHKLSSRSTGRRGCNNGILLADAPKLFPKKTPYSRKEIEKLREALLGERERLLHELNSLHGASRAAMEETRDHPGYSMHLAEHATDLQTAEASLGLRTIEQERLELVDEALDRIKSNINHYGLCLACGNKIGIQRLIARPHAHLCMDCRQRYEKIRARRGL